MNYIEELNKGYAIIIKYIKAQKDECDNEWYQETWYKVKDDSYKCEYLDCDFTSEHSTIETRQLFRDAQKMEIDKEAVIQVLETEYQSSINIEPTNKIEKLANIIKATGFETADGNKSISVWDEGVFEFKDGENSMLIMAEDLDIYIELFTRAKEIEYKSWKTIKEENNL